VHVGLNKGEAKNALAKAVFFNRLGEMRDRSFESQRYRSRSLNIAGHPKRVVQMIVPEVQLDEWPP
jgi:TnpA family transposase